MYAAILSSSVFIPLNWKLNKINIKLCKHNKRGLSTTLMDSYRQSPLLQQQCVALQKDDPLAAEILLQTEEALQESCEAARKGEALAAGRKLVSENTVAISDPQGLSGAGTSFWTSRSGCVVQSEWRVAKAYGGRGNYTERPVRPTSSSFSTHSLLLVDEPRT